MKITYVKFRVKDFVGSPVFVDGVKYAAGDEGVTGCKGEDISDCSLSRRPIAKFFALSKPKKHDITPEVKARVERVLLANTKGNPDEIKASFSDQSFALYQAQNDKIAELQAQLTALLETKEPAAKEPAAKEPAAKEPAAKD